MLNKNSLTRRLLMILPVFLIGCDRIELKREYYPDGRPSAEQAFLVLPGGLVPHGLSWTWYPGGGRRSLDIFVRGEREGYSFRWNERDSLVRLDYCSDGMCEPRIVSGDAPIASAFPR